MSSFTSSSLYVGDLPVDVTETQLFDVFKQIGSVASIRVCRDAITRRSLGYAYVNFHNVTDAENAFENLNYAEVKGKPIRIMWSHRDPSIRKSGVGNIFIKNLEKSIDNKQLFDTFSRFGKILSCKVMQDNGVSRGFGFVHYEKQEEADLAIAKVNNMILGTKQVYVGPFIPKKDKSQTTRFTNVYVKNLDPSFDDTQLISLFEKFGKITRAAVMKTTTGASRQFGFVNFSTPEEAQAAVAELNEKELNGKILYVGRAQKKSERASELERMSGLRKLKYQGSNLYIKNLDDSIDDEKLRAEFSQFGTITSSKVMKDGKGISRGFGFVCFSDPEEATKAITEMNGRLLVSKPIYVALAQRREDRRAQLEAKYLQSQVGSHPVGPPPSIFSHPSGASPAVFYTPGAPIPGSGPRQNYMYSAQMVPRNRWSAGAAPGQQSAPGQAYQSGPNFPVSSLRPQRTRQRNAQQNVPPSSAGRGSNQGNRRNFKFSNNVRNYPQSHNGAEHEASAEAGVDGTGQKVSVSAFATGNPEESKMVLGETLYALIAVQEPIHAAKITGMFLESMDLPELIQLVESNENLSAKVAEACAVLQAHSQNGPEELSA